MLARLESLVLRELASLTIASMTGRELRRGEERGEARNMRVVIDVMTVSSESLDRQPTTSDTPSCTATTTITKTANMKQH